MVDPDAVYALLLGVKEAYRLAIDGDDDACVPCILVLVIPAAMHQMSWCVQHAHAAQIATLPMLHPC